MSISFQGGLVLPSHVSQDQLPNGEPLRETKGDFESPTIPNFQRSAKPSGWGPWLMSWPPEPDGARRLHRAEEQTHVLA